MIGSKETIDELRDRAKTAAFALERARVLANEAEFLLAVSLGVKAMCWPKTERIELPF